MPDSNKPFLIGITGGSGSGKTSFISALRDRFTEDQVCIISQDHYYKTRDEQIIDDQGVRNFDLPSSIDQQQFKQDVQRLIRGEIVEKEEYTFNNDLKTPETYTFKPAPVIIMEGLFVFKIDEIRDQLNLKLFVHAKDNLKVIRRILRDQVERNYPLDDVLYRYQHHVLPTFEQYIAPYKEEADVVINNNDQFIAGLNVLSGYISNLLNRK